MYSIIVLSYFYRGAVGRLRVTIRPVHGSKPNLFPQFLHPGPCKISIDSNDNRNRILIFFRDLKLSLRLRRCSLNRILFIRHQNWNLKKNPNLHQNRRIPCGTAANNRIHYSFRLQQASYKNAYIRNINVFFK